MKTNLEQLVSNSFDVEVEVMNPYTDSRIDIHENPYCEVQLCNRYTDRPIFSYRIDCGKYLDQPEVQQMALLNAMNVLEDFIKWLGTNSIHRLDLSDEELALVKSFVDRGYDYIGRDNLRKLYLITEDYYLREDGNISKLFTEDVSGGFYGIGRKEEYSLKEILEVYKNRLAFK